MHFDHIGWSSIDGQAVFPNATCRCPAADWDHFVGTDAQATAKLEPIADRVQTFEGTATLLPGVDGELAPGHTPGSTKLRA